jgi:hypothetical protein
MPRKLSYILPAIITFLNLGAAYADEPRFVPLDHAGKPLPLSEQTRSDWPCVFDRRTGLTWEVKTQQPGRHFYLNTYSWFDSESTRNGGLAGEPGGNDCRDTVCDTQSFIRAVNQETLCGARDWRLPHREELRSLVDYQTPYPGPTIDTRAFPNAIAQFYWSADTSAAEASEAWGIGFAFGFDYAYFKTNRVHVRLVRGKQANKREIRAP